MIFSNYYQPCSHNQQSWKYNIVTNNIELLTPNSARPQHPPVEKVGPTLRTQSSLFTPLQNELSDRMQRPFYKKKNERNCVLLENVQNRGGIITKFSSRTCFFFSSLLFIHPYRVENCQFLGNCFPPRSYSFNHKKTTNSYPIFLRITHFYECFFAFFNHSNKRFSSTFSEEKLHALFLNAFRLQNSRKMFEHKIARLEARLLASGLTRKQMRMTNFDQICLWSQLRIENNNKALQIITRNI